MKSSIYNMYIKNDTGYTVFNTFTWAVGSMDSELKTLVEENPDEIPEDILQSLLENGFVVEDKYDERKRLAYFFDKDKYNVNVYDLVYIVAVTYTCNLRCPYCYEGTEKDPGFIDNKKVDILLKNIEKNFGKKNFHEFLLGLYGGEPLLIRDQCIRLMEGASALCSDNNVLFDGNIVTNGVLITEDVIENLIIPYCRTVQITMDGGRDAHNKRRIRKDGGGTYDTILDAISLLKDSGRPPDVRLNVDRENAYTFGELFEDLKDRGLGDIKVSLGWVHPPDEKLVGEGCSGYTDMCFSHQEMANFEDIMFGTMDELGVVYDKPKLVKHSPCTFDREDAFLIGPYLDLYKCWEFVGQKDKQVGHLNGDGEVVLNHEYFEQVGRNPLQFEECRECVYLPLCGGGCAARAYLEFGTYNSPSCGRYKLTAQERIERYVKEELSG